MKATSDEESSWKLAAKLLLAYLENALAPQILAIALHPL